MDKSDSDWDRANDDMPQLPKAKVFAYKDGALVADLSDEPRFPCTHRPECLRLFATAKEAYNHELRVHLDPQYFELPEGYQFRCLPPASPSHDHAVNDLPCLVSSSFKSVASEMAPINSLPSSGVPHRQYETGMNLRFTSYVGAKLTSIKSYYQIAGISLPGKAALLQCQS